MDTGVFELPNAIQTDAGQWVKEIELEEMTGEDEDILADQTRGGKGKFVKSPGQRMTEILSRCTVRLGDLRRPEGKDRFNTPNFFYKAWENAYTNDRSFALIRLRQVSLGDKMVFEETCPECRKDLSRVAVDLNDLRVQSSPLEVACQQQREIVLPKSKDRITWRPFTGKDDGLMEEISTSRKGDFLSAVLLARIVAVNGNAPKNGVDYVKRMSQLDRRFMMKYLDEAEGGIDMTMTITCDSCSAEFERPLNVGHKSFFFPSEV